MNVVNIVCSGSFNQPLDLGLLASECDCVEYGRNRYPGGYIKIDGHSVTIYRTGKYIMPGMKSMEDVASTFEKVKGVLSPYVDVSLFSEPEVRNLVCSSDVRRSLNLSRMYRELTSAGYEVEYEPESFPGLILRAWGGTFNVFSSGKFLILGFTTEKQASHANLMFLELCGEMGYRRGSSLSLASNRHHHFTVIRPLLAIDCHLCFLARHFSKSGEAQPPLVRL